MAADAGWYPRGGALYRADGGGAGRHFPADNFRVQTGERLTPSAHTGQFSKNDSAKMAPEGDKPAGCGNHATGAGNRATGAGNRATDAGIRATGEGDFGRK